MKLFHRKLNQKKVQQKWLELTKKCVSRKTWPEAIKLADELLDTVLKKKGYKGKTTGERLVSAQHDMSYNEEIWYSHKFAQKIKEIKIDVRTFKKKEVVKVLAGFRQALRDLGALKKDD